MVSPSAPPLDTPLTVDQAAQVAQESGFVDYFGFGETVEFTLPDGVSKIQYRKMSEGDRAKYQRQTSQDVRIDRRTNDMSMKLNGAVDRHALINAAVVGWNLQRSGQAVTFSKDSPGSTLMQFVNGADPKIIDDLEVAIRKANPWSLGDTDSKSLLEERDRLDEMITLAQEKEAGEAVSGVK